MLRPAALAFLLALTATTVQAQGVGVRYSSIGPKACALHDTGEPRGEDWILYRCAGVAGIAVWVLYTDSVRMQLAFGPQELPGYVPFNADRDDAWPVEWRTRKGAKTPYAAVVRMRRPGETTGSELAVYRIARNRPTCFLGTAPTNEAARALADAPPKPGDCDPE